MEKKGAAIILIWFLIIILIIGIIPCESSHFLMKAHGEYKEFKTEKFNENITLSYGVIKALDFNLEKGKEFEIVYTVQVKEVLPIDLWLVNEDNYLLLVSDVNFLYYIDGSDQECYLHQKNSNT